MMNTADNGTSPIPVTGTNSTGQSVSTEVEARLRDAHAAVDHPDDNSVPRHHDLSSFPEEDRHWINLLSEAFVGNALAVISIGKSVENCHTKRVSCWFMQAC